MADTALCWLLQHTDGAGHQYAAADTEQTKHAGLVQSTSVPQQTLLCLLSSELVGPAAVPAHCQACASRANSLWQH